jgi:hypothetical protein
MRELGNEFQMETSGLSPCFVRAFCGEAALWLRFTHQIVKQSHLCFTVAHRHLPAR